MYRLNATRNRRIRIINGNFIWMEQVPTLEVYFVLVVRFPNSWICNFGRVWICCCFDAWNSPQKLIHTAVKEAIVHTKNSMQNFCEVIINNIVLQLLIHRRTNIHTHPQLSSSYMNTACLLERLSLIKETKCWRKCRCRWTCENTEFLYALKIYLKMYTIIQCIYIAITVSQVSNNFEVQHIHFE